MVIPRCSYCLVVFCLTLYTLPTTEQLSIRNTHSSMENDEDDYHGQRKRFDSRAAKDMAAVVVDMPRATCEDPDIFDLCYACARDLKEQIVLDNCCGMDIGTRHYCNWWLQSGK